MAHERGWRSNGIAIRAFREKEDLSVAKLASWVGIAPQSLRNIENGFRPAGTRVLRQLARVLDVPVAAITKDGTDEGINGDDDGAEAEEAA